MMKKKKKSKVIWNILLVIALIVMAFSGYMLYKELQPELNSQQEQKKLEKIVKEDTLLNPDWDKLKEVNPDIIAWIYIEGTDINYPIVQTTDNSYYLNHSVYKEENPYGSIFLDYETPSNFSAYNSILYGHSIAGNFKEMFFTPIKDFEDDSYFNEHTTLYILTPEQNYRGDIIAFTKTTEESYLYTHGDLSDTDKETYEQTLKTEAIQYRDDVAIDTDSQFVMLSTCDLDYGLHSNQRLILHAVLSSWDKDITISE